MLPLPTKYEQWSKMGQVGVPGARANRCTQVCQVIRGAPQVAVVVKKPPANARDTGDAGSIPGSGRSPGRGHGNPLQYSCLETMDRGAWWAVVPRVAKNRT